MGFDQPTMRMRKGYLTGPVFRSYGPPKPNRQLDPNGLQLLLPASAINPPPTQLMANSFAITLQPIEDANAPYRWEVKFNGFAIAWYVPFMLRREVRIPIAFGGVVEDPPAIIKLNADPPAVMWGNPALYPLSSDGSFKLFPEAGDAKVRGVDIAQFKKEDLEFFSLDFKKPLPLNDKGALELPKDARIPIDLAQRPFLVEVRVHERDCKGERTGQVIKGQVPFQL